jgi:hypothetical protein
MVFPITLHLAYWLQKQKIKDIEMHQPGIEPGASAWQAEILPLNH